METVAVNCNNCGAPLQVGADTNFVTCTHCASRLAVKRTGAAAYTEMLDRLEQKTDAIAEQVGELVRQNEVERIDREWEQEKAKYMVRSKSGQTYPPTVAGGVIAVVVAGAFGVFWVTMTSSMNAPGMFTLFGVGIIGLAVMMGFGMVAKAKQYEAAERKYRDRRAAAQVGTPPPGDTGTPA